MKKLTILLSSCLVGVPVYAQLAVGNPEYEPFSNATGSGGTSYSPGANLAGQTPASYAAYNPTGQGWWELGPDGATGGGVQPTIASGDLSVPGLDSAGGGQSAAFTFTGSGNSARLNMTTGTGGVTSGTVYYSFALKLTDLSRLDTTGTYFAGFNVVQSHNSGLTGTPGTVGPRIQARSDGAGFDIGIQKGSSGTGAAWYATAFGTADTLFLVGSYTFNPSTGDDVAQLWVNPSATTFGNASAPGGRFDLKHRD